MKKCEKCGKTTDKFTAGKIICDECWKKYCEANEKMVAESEADSGVEIEQDHTCSKCGKTNCNCGM